MVQPLPPEIYWVARFYINNFEDICNVAMYPKQWWFVGGGGKVGTIYLIKVGVFKLTGLPCPSPRTCFQVSSKSCFVQIGEDYQLGHNDWNFQDVNHCSQMTGYDDPNEFGTCTPQQAAEGVLRWQNIFFFQFWRWDSPKSTSGCSQGPGPRRLHVWPPETRCPLVVDQHGAFFILWPTIIIKIFMQLSDPPTNWCRHLTRQADV